MAAIFERKLDTPLYSRHGHDEDRKAQHGFPGHLAKTAMALSGGGIRSAAFSLGGVIAVVDGGMSEVSVMSTVSGGGYTGTALFAHLHALGAPGRRGMSNAAKALGDQLKEARSLPYTQVTVPGLGLKFSHTALSWGWVLALCIMLRFVLACAISVHLGYTASTFLSFVVFKPSVPLWWLSMGLASVGTISPWLVAVARNDMKAAGIAPGNAEQCARDIFTLHFGKLVFIGANSLLVYLQFVCYFAGGMTRSNWCFLVVACGVVVISLCLRARKDGAALAPALIGACGLTTAAALVLMAFAAACAKLCQYQQSGEEGIKRLRVLLAWSCVVIGACLPLHELTNHWFFNYYRRQLVNAFYPRDKKGDPKDPCIRELASEPALFVNTTAHHVHTWEDISAGRSAFLKNFVFTNAFPKYSNGFFGRSELRPSEPQTQCCVKLSEAMAISGAAVAMDFGPGAPLMSFLKVFLVVGVDMGAWYDMAKGEIMNMHWSPGYIITYGLLACLFWSPAALIWLESDDLAALICWLTYVMLFSLVAISTKTVEPKGAHGAWLKVSIFLRRHLNTLRFFHHVILNNPIVHDVSFTSIPHVFLSDGGHLENMAMLPFLYAVDSKHPFPLSDDLKRIVVMDGEASQPTSYENVARLSGSENSKADALAREAKIENEYCLHSRFARFTREILSWMPRDGSDLRSVQLLRVLKRCPRYFPSVDDAKQQWVRDIRNSNPMLEIGRKPAVRV